MSEPRMLSVDEAVAVLCNGGVVVYPTEGVWGIGCAADQTESILRVLEAKRRESDKGLILIAAETAALEPYVDPLPAHDWEEIAAAPTVTWLLPAAGVSSSLLRGDSEQQAVRVTVHPVCQKLCAGAGALVSSSANFEGEPPVADAAAAQALFGDTIDGVVDGALGGATGPSEIRDFTSGTVIRPAA